MISKAAFLFTILLVTSTYTGTTIIYAAQIAQSQIPVSNQKHLADLLLAHLGLNSGKASEEIKKYISDNRISIMNAVDEIALVFVDGQEIKQNKQFQITNQFVENLGNSINKIKAHFLTGKSEQQVQTYIKQNFKGQKYQQINVQTHQISKIQSYFTSQSPSPSASTPRLLQQTTVVKQEPSSISSSYITKFFFIILFILVTMGSLFAIASMDNKKDSLLYAKFLTDVNGR